MKKFVIVCVIAAAMIQCAKEKDFSFRRGEINSITSTTKVQELEAIFAQDSLVSHLDNDDFAESTYDEYEVYSTTGEHLLTIVPKMENDSSSTIERVQIFSKKYMSDKGVGLGSVFKDIANNYHINKVESTFTTAVLFVDELDATISIDKKELGIKDFGTQKVTLEQIPDLAKVKTFTLWFD